MKKGNGSVYQRSRDGRWIGALCIGQAGGKRKRKQVCAATREEAAAKLEALRRERHTVAYALKGFLSHRDIAPKTRHGYECLIRLHIVPRLGHLEMSRVTVQDVEALMADIQRQGRSPTTARNAKTLLTAALYDAQGNRAIGPRNASSLAKTPKIHPRHAEPMTLERARLILDAVRGTRIELQVFLSLILGFRQGELLGLQWNDIDFARSLIRIQRGLMRLQGQWTFVPCKTPTSQRTLPMPRPLAAMLVKHGLRQREEQAGANGDWQGARWDNLVFADATGSPLLGWWVTRQFRAALSMAELPQMRWQDLRRGAADLVGNQGTALRLAMELLGHVLPDPANNTVGIYHVANELPKRLLTEETDRLAAAVIRNPAFCGANEAP